MLAYTYISHGKFELIDKPKPELQGPRDAIVRITLGSICTSDLHIKHGSVPRAVLIEGQFFDTTNSSVFADLQSASIETGICNPI